MQVLEQHYLGLVIVQEQLSDVGLVGVVQAVVVRGQLSYVVTAQDAIVLGENCLRTIVQRVIV